MIFYDCHRWWNIEPWFLNEASAQDRTYSVKNNFGSYSCKHTAQHINITNSDAIEWMILWCEDEIYLLIQSIIHSHVLTINRGGGGDFHHMEQSF